MGTEKSAEVKKASRTVGTRLRQERERLGLTQSELAEQIGTTQFNVSRWENGVTTPGLYNRQRLGKLFGKSLQELGFVKETEEESAEQEIADLSPQTNQNVPHRRNPFFTGREDILHRLSIALSAHKPTALTQAQAISGLGGIGKTQIAVEYVYRYRHLYDTTFWVNASPHSALVHDFVALAELLDLPEQKDQEGIVIESVKRWLATHKNWLLILDNVEDLEMVTNFLPIHSQGSILLTTRSQALGSLAQNVEVEKMEPNVGMLFLLRRAKILAPEEPLDQASKAEQARAKEIVNTLDGLPLALDQAGAYIDETKCGLQGYLDLYHVHRTALLQRRGKLFTDHPESVTATWSLSFQRVEQANPAAADLLRLCAFLDAQAIPEEIISKGAPELGPQLSSVAADPLALNEAIGQLLRYSLIRRYPEKRSLGIHRLVQAVLKDEMDQALQRTWAERVIRALNRAFPDVEPETWAACQHYLPHVQLATLYIEEYRFAFPEAARLLSRTIIYLMDHVRHAKVEELLLQKTLAMPQQILEPYHPDTATMLNDLGRLYFKQGNYEQAERLLQQALDIRQQVLEASHPDVAQTLNYLAELYTAQGRYDLAQPLYSDALNIQEQTLDANDPDVAKTLTSLALFYRAKGEYAQSARLYLKALNIQKRMLDPNDPDVAQTLNDLARLYRAQGEYAAAEPCYLQALDIRQRVFGPDHPYTAQSFHSLAKLRYSQGKYAEAHELCRRALSIQEQWLGYNHPTIASTLGLLAKISQVQQQYAQAEEYYRRALAIRESTLGPDHPFVAVLLSSLAELYHTQSKYSEARPLIERSLVIRKHTLGQEHPYFAYSLSNLAENCSIQGDYTQAELLHKQALDIRRRVLGPEHPQIASSYHHLATLYLTLNRYAEAESLYERTLAIRQQTLGPEHPEVANTLERYAQLLRKTERADLACEFEARARAIRASK